MPIQFFSGHQDDVFIPALVVVLIGAAIVALPVMFALRVAKMRRRGVVIGATVVVAVVTVAAAVALAVPGFGTISAQVGTLRADVQSRYGISLTSDQAQDLVDGDSIVIPGVANDKKVLLFPSSPHSYVLTTKGLAEELPAAS